MLRLFSPAKINLFLRILRRRKDGYHELATLMQAVTLGDVITYELSSQCEDSLTVSNSFLPVDGSNLILKAAKLYREKTGADIFISAHIEKKIPWEAGLGGGSGNAATTLWAMNALNPDPVSEERLRIWGGDIGSDVAFFFSTGTAYCTGRGDCVQSLKPRQKQQFTIVKPPYGLATPAIFARLQADALPKRDPKHVLELFKRGKGEYFNDLEACAFQEEPRLRNLYEVLQEENDVDATIMMTGSGTALFCVGTLENIPQENKVYKVFSTQREQGEWYSALNSK